jgi:carbamoyltransferase
VTAPWILGISASHNGAVCLLQGDEIVVAVQEERLTRQKRARLRGAAPALAIRYCLDYARIAPADLSLVAISAQSRLSSVDDDVRLNPLLQVGLRNIPVVTLSHHAAHAYSAFATSGFEEAAVLVADGAGSPAGDLSPEEARVALAPGRAEVISLYHAERTSLVPVEKHLGRDEWLIPTPSGVGMPRFHSLGGMFSAVAKQLFGETMEAGKVMGLAPHGQPIFPPESFFEISGGHFLFKDDVPRRFEHDDRWPARAAEYQDLAASCQAALEVALLELCRRLRARSDFLCFAGGVALNSVANQRIVRESGFRDAYFIPAAEDSGPAIGAAYHGLWTLTGRNTRRRLRRDAMGKRYTAAEIDAAVKATPAVAVTATDDVIARAVDLLCDGKILGWFQGRSELGPRALGQRSILCDPRPPGAKERLNARVKHREMFRPFAPAILATEISRWFEAAPGEESPFMLRVLPFLPGQAERVPAVSHVDGTGRVQTLTEEDGPFFALVTEFFRRTGVPMILNTSFNVMGEPIVETPEDALWALLYTDLDAVVFEDRILTRSSEAASFLDLVPYVTASSCTVEHRLPAGGIAREPYPLSTMSLATSTPWGPTRCNLPAGVLEVLAHIDGVATGWTLLARLAASEGTRMTEAELRQLLGKLRRSRVIAFRAPGSEAR